MDVGITHLMWITSVVFTLASFIVGWRKFVIFPLLAGIFWVSTGLGLTEVDYVGFGSVNVITYQHQSGDWSGDVGLQYLCNGMGMIMFIFALYNVFIIARGDLSLVEEGKAGSWERIN